MAKFTGVNHLAMVTADMDATIRFWRDLLGMRLVVGLGRPGYRHYFFEISDLDTIAFFEWPHVRPIPEKDHGVPVKGPAVFDHVSLGVKSQKDLWEIKDKLEAAHVWASEVLDHGFIHSLYSFDPNGIPIEFSWPVPEMDMRARPMMVDTHPTQTTMQGPEPVPGHWPEVSEPTTPEDQVVYPGEGRELTGAKENQWKSL